MKRYVIMPLVAAMVAMVAMAAATTATEDRNPSEPIRYGDARKVGVLANDKIDESSGVAVGHRGENLWWTHNDNGNPALLFAFGPAGEDRGVFPVRGATNRDWEDIASFVLDGKPYLLIADVGDNDRRRSDYRLYVVGEPATRTETRPAEAAKVAATIDFRYEDGPHNCEAAAVDVPGRAIYLITKEKLPVARVVRLPLRVKPAEKAAVPETARTVALERCRR